MSCRSHHACCTANVILSLWPYTMVACYTEGDATITAGLSIARLQIHYIILILQLIQNCYGKSCGNHAANMRQICGKVAAKLRQRCGKVAAKLRQHCGKDVPMTFIMYSETQVYRRGRFSCYGPSPSYSYSNSYSCSCSCSYSYSYSYRYRVVYS